MIKHISFHMCFFFSWRRASAQISILTTVKDLSMSIEMLPISFPEAINGSKGCPKAVLHNLSWSSVITLFLFRKVVIIHDYLLYTRRPGESWGNLLQFHNGALCETTAHWCICRRGAGVELCWVHMLVSWLVCCWNVAHLKHVHIHVYMYIYIYTCIYM